MRKLIFDKVLIISAELSGLDQYENTRRNNNLRDCLEDLGVKYKEAVGFYKGVPELSFVVLPKNILEKIVVTDLALKKFQQESVLFQNNHGDAVLIYANGLTDNIGQLRKTDEIIALRQDSYTYMDGEYYTTGVA